MPLQGQAQANSRNTTCTVVALLRMLNPTAVAARHLTLL